MSVAAFVLMLGLHVHTGTWSERDLDASTYLGEAHEEAWDEKTRSCLWVLSETKFAKNLFIHRDQSEQTIPPNGCLLPASPSPHIAAPGLTCDTFRLLRRQVLRPLPTPAREPESVCSSTLGTVTRWVFPKCCSRTVHTGRAG